MTDLEQLRYPVGRFERVTAPLDRAPRDTHIIDIIEQTPARFRALDAGSLTESQLDTPYRPGGWTDPPGRASRARQPHERLHPHEARAHRRRADDQDVRRTTWAELPDAKTGPTDMSLALLEALHRAGSSCCARCRTTTSRGSSLHKEWGLVTVDEASRCMRGTAATTRRTSKERSRPRELGGTGRKGKRPARSTFLPIPPILHPADPAHPAQLISARNKACSCLQPEAVCERCSCSAARFLAGFSFSTASTT